jgi:mannose-6-phosphate isomerase-like protein (cupin superfamily)
MDDLRRNLAKDFAALGDSPGPDDVERIGNETVQMFDLSRVLVEQEKSNRSWLEFLRVPLLSMGVYHLKAGQPDLQQPHTEDEVYYVVHGRASFWAGGEQRAVGPGMLIFVERSVEHRFYDVTEDLTVLVFFAPPEGSLAAPAEIEQRLNLP